MRYQSFAYLYDQLMSEAPYDEWFAFFQRTIDKYNVAQNKPILDVGTGTGQFLLRLCEHGYDASGVDLSEHMLTVAAANLNERGHRPLLVAQNMCELQLGMSFSAITVFCDSLNYLLTKEDVLRAFQRFYEHLEPNGLLLFDVHSPSKIANGFVGRTFADAGEDISYIWTSFAGKTSHSVEHELTFFVKNEHGLYDRYDELHIQRTFSVETYRSLLEQARFRVCEVSANFGDEWNETSERIFFIAQKQEFYHE